MRYLLDAKSTDLKMKSVDYDVNVVIKEFMDWVKQNEIKRKDIVYARIIELGDVATLVGEILLKDDGTAIIYPKIIYGKGIKWKILNYLRNLMN